MSKKHPLWAIERPDGTIIQESVCFQDRFEPWTYATDYDKKAKGIYNSDPNASVYDCLKKAGYKLVKVKAVKCV